MLRSTAGRATPRENCETIRREVRAVGAELAAAYVHNAHQIAIDVVANRYGINRDAVQWVADPRTSLEGV